MVFSWLFAIPLGMLAAVYRNRWIDKVIGFISFSGLSPQLVLSLLMTCSRPDGPLPRGGIHDQVMWDVMTPWQNSSTRFGIWCCRWLCWAPSVSHEYVRQMRSEMIETLSQDYIEPRAPGLSGWRVPTRHALGNAINPLVTIRILAGNLAKGALLTEFVFAWPGLGTLIFDALTNKDEPLVMASVMMLALMLVVGNLIADVLLAVIDPRIRLE
jgi:peptide/nickel transport system permease protein